MPPIEADAGEIRLLELCRVCGSSMDRVKQTELKPNLVVVRMTCPACGATALREDDRRGWNTLYTGTRN